MNKRVLLVGFYNEKALGVRYLANSLKMNGYEPHILFFKTFNSLHPKKASKKELDILKKLITKIDPCFIGLSVMSSLYLETVELVNDMINKNFKDIPVAWGGVIATLLPERAIEHCDFVMRGEGEVTIVEVLDRITNNQDYKDLLNLVYRDDNGEIVINDVRELEQDIDVYGYPTVGDDNMYFIHDDVLKEGDPQLHSFSYELSASRGCPFACSYCGSINLHRVYKGKGKYVRFRSVESIMDELNDAKKKIPRLKVIHFWDEIFCDEPGWVEEFSKRYKKEINIPFRIWGHPLKISKNVFKPLVDAGLYQIVVGIQSGSVKIRRDIFHRPETQEQIIESSKILTECKVPRVIYDLMLQHPFESLQDLKETFYLCTKLATPFDLSMHGLNFLPATDIVDMAIDQGIYTKEELDEMMFSSIQQQYDQHWGPDAYNKINEDNVWIALIYLTQFPSIRKKVLKLAEKVEQGQGQASVLRLKNMMEKYLKAKKYYNKARLVLKRNK